MAMVEDTGSVCQSLMRRVSSTQSSVWTAASERLNGASWQHLTVSSFGSCDDDESPEVVNLRRLIAEQNAALDERRRRIEATELQIEKYERCIHNDRCAQDGYDYLQRAYKLVSSYDENEKDRKMVTDDTIAVYYKEATNEIRQRLVEVETKLFDIANDGQRNKRADEEYSKQVDEFNQTACCDVDQRPQLVVNAHRRHGFQLDALRLELERAEDTRRQQLVEHDRLSSAINDAQTQLDDEEVRMVAMLAACDESSPSSYGWVGIRQSRPVKITTEKPQTAEHHHRHIEKDPQIARRSDPDAQTLISAATGLMSSTSDFTRLIDSRKDSIYDKYNVANKSHEIYACGDMFASDSVSEDAGFSSLPDDDDLFIDCHQLVTLV